MRHVLPEALDTQVKNNEAMLCLSRVRSEVEYLLLSIEGEGAEGVEHPAHEIITLAEIRQKTEERRRENYEAFLQCCCISTTSV